SQFVMLSGSGFTRPWKWSTVLRSSRSPALKTSVGASAISTTSGLPFRSAAFRYFEGNRSSLLAMIRSFRFGSGLLVRVFRTGLGQRLLLNFGKFVPQLLGKLLVQSAAAQVLYWQPVPWPRRWLARGSRRSPVRGQSLLLQLRVHD